MFDNTPFWITWARSDVSYSITMNRFFNLSTLYSADGIMTSISSGVKQDLEY